MIMAVPTLTWYSVAGAAPFPPATNEPEGLGVLALSGNILDYGSVQAGEYSDIKCVVAKPVGANLTSIKFWWYSHNANKGEMLPGEGHNWAHQVKVLAHASYVNPIGDTLDNGYHALGITSGTAETPNVAGVADGAYTDCIYLAIQPPTDSADGLWTGFGYRLSFLYYT